MPRPGKATTPPMHMPTFFNWCRRAPFGGRLSQSQVDGMNALLVAWEKHGDDDNRKLAYILATNFHETGGRMQPVREGFASSDASARRAVNNLARRRGPNSAVAKYAKPGAHGNVFYGRGDVQLTWERNYRLFEELLGIPLVKNPDLALKAEVSKQILIEGMMRGKSDRGDFTGKALEDYFNETRDDPVGARRIVNGTDKDQLIAGYHHHFLKAIEAGQEAHQGERREEDPQVPQTANLIGDPTAIGGLLSACGGVLGSVVSMAQEVDNPYTLIAFGIVVVSGLLVLTGRVKLQYKTGE